MALKRTFCEEDFSCPVCFDIFTEPVLLSCGHSACKACINTCWNTKGTRECPLCRKRSTKNPPVNLALRNLCQTFQELRGCPEAQCDVHREALRLFCVDDGQPVCLVCRDSNKHLHHHFRPVDEAAAELKDVIKSALVSLSRRLKSLKDGKFNCEKNIDFLTPQAEYIKDQINGEFKKLQQFLKDENTAMVTRLMEEKQKRKESLTNQIKEMNQEILSLSSTIRDVTKDLELEDVMFLKNFEATLSKSQRTSTNSRVTSGEVISVAKYLGNLQFTVWQTMQSIIKYTPVILDPNTAHSQLVLSADLTSVRDSDDDEDDTRRTPVLSTPERFDRSYCVLGSEGFYTGINSWDVDVGNSTFWMLGVTVESVQRKEQNVFPSAVWGIGYDYGKLCARSPLNACTPLPNAIKPQVVRIRLDMNAGEVWFLDAASNAVIHMFSHRFTEKVFPFFHSLCSLSSLKIMPLQPFVVLRKESTWDSLEL